MDIVDVTNHFLRVSLFITVTMNCKIKFQFSLTDNEKSVMLMDDANNLNKFGLHRIKPLYESAAHSFARGYS